MKLILSCFIFFQLIACTSLPPVNPRDPVGSSVKVFTDLIKKPQTGRGSTWAGKPSVSRLPAHSHNALYNKHKNPGIWTGALKCGRKGEFKVRLTFWELEQDKFYGKLNLQSIERGGNPIEYSVKGRKHEYGSLQFEPDYQQYRNFYKDYPFSISISSRLDPETKKMSTSIMRGCHSSLTLKPIPSKGVNELAKKYGKYNKKMQAKRDKEVKVKNAKEYCANQSKLNTGPMARYSGGSSYMKAPAFKRGLFVYRHICLTKQTGKPALIYSKTAPDSPGGTIKVFSGPFDKGVLVSRRDITILSMPQVCRIFDYSVVGGKKLFCEPYGWRYTNFVRKQCLSNSGNMKALQCQFMVMGQTIKPFERGPKQVSR